MAQLAVAVAVGVLINVLFPPKTQTIKGPRLTDLRAPQSSYGVDIPTVWGSKRVEGNLDWAADLIEVKKESGGGKGSPKYINYSYYGDFIVGLCEGPVDAIRKIWADGFKIYDAGDDNLQSVTTNISGTFVMPAGAKEKYPGVILCYSGSETQTPDPLYESYVGAGNAPAFRGKAYIRFKRLPLAKFGNRIPTITAEVVRSTGETFPKALFGNSSGPNAYAPHATEPIMWTRNGNTLYKINRLTGDVILAADSGAGADHNLTHNCHINHITGDVITGASWIQSGLVSYTRLYAADGETGAIKDTYLHGGNVAGAFVDVLTWVSLPIGLDQYEHFVLLGKGAGTHRLISFDEDSGFADFEYEFANADTFGDGRNAAVHPTRREIAFLSNPQGGISIDGIVTIYERPMPPPDVVPGQIVTLTPRLARTWTDIGIPPGDNDAKFIFYDYATDCYIVQTTSTIWKLNSTTLDIEGSYEFSDGSITGNLSWGQATIQPYLDGSYAHISGANHQNAFVLDTETMTVSEAWSITGFDDWGMGQIGSPFFDPFMDGWWGKLTDGSNSGADGIFFKSRVGRDRIAISEIITDFATRSGLTALDLDLTDIDDILCDGFARQNQTTFRKCIEVLQQAYRFDVVERNGKLKFVKRAKPPLLTIPYDDLAASANGQTPPARMRETTQQEVELPHRISVKFWNASKRYDVDEVHFQRATGATSSKRELTYELPLVMTPSEAKACAEISMAEIWTARKRIEGYLPPKYLPLAPTDVVQVQKVSDAGTAYFRIRITEFELGDAMVCRFRGEVVKAEQFNPPAIADETDGGYADNPIPFDVASIPILLNTPVLDDGVDDDGGFWMGAGQSMTTPVTSWSGATMFRSADSGATYSEAQVFLDQPTFGYAGTVLASTDRWTTWDRVNTVDVVIANGGELSSVTDLECLNGSNWAMVGDELIGFATVEELGTGRYRLSRLLRGRNGTEQSVGSHVAGERFTIVDDLSKFVRYSSLSEKDLERLYKAVTFGRAPEDATAHAFTNTSRALKPWAVCQIRGSRDGSDNLTIEWYRRNRYAGELVDSYEIGFVDQDVYDLEIMNGGSVARTISDNSGRSYVYSAADQTTDFGSPQASVTVRIYHKSASYGRGYVREATI
jgi:hypothetical protein